MQQSKKKSKIKQQMLNHNKINNEETIWLVIV